METIKNSQYHVIKMFKSKRNTKHTHTHTHTHTQTPLEAGHFQEQVRLFSVQGC